MTGVSKKTSYAEGDIFAVPLPDGLFAVGVVARATRKRRVILAYFFGLKLSESPTDRSAFDLQAANASKAVRVGDLHIVEGKWPVIGRVRDWRREEWPMPRYIRRGVPEIGSPALIITYHDDDPLVPIAEQRCEQSTTGLENDSVWGAGFAEAVLDRDLLDG